MRRYYPKVSAAKVHSSACTELKTLLPWKAVGRALSVDTMLRLLWLMTCWRSSLHAVMGRLVFGCCENTAWRGIRSQLPDVVELSARLSTRLVEMIGRLRRRSFHIAIDTHYSPYYGNKTTAGVVGGQLKASTRKFFVYATACIIESGRRYTLAVVAVESGRPAAALAPLLEHLAVGRVKIRSLSLDKGFFAAEVFALLHRHRVPYVVAVPHNRRELKRFFRGRSDSASNYTLRSRSKPAVPITIRLRRVRYRRSGRRRTEVYAVHRMGRMSDDAIRAHYRRRFAIESSYRQLREVKAPTTCKDQAWRLLMVGLALLFRQLWAWLDAAWHKLAKRDRPRRMTLKKLAWLAAHGLVDAQNLSDEASKSSNSGTH